MPIKKNIVQNIFLKFLFHPRLKLLRHLVLLVVIVFFAFQNVEKAFDSTALYYAFILNIVVFIVPVYSNIYILIPKLLIKKKLLLYTLLLITIISVSLFIMTLCVKLLSTYYPIPLPNSWIDDPYSPLNIVSAIITIGLVTLGTTSIELFRRWFLYDQQISELQTVTIKSELQQLKNQINPHFLFNMLNNVNTLVQADPKEASRVLVKLDDMLQYQLKDSIRNEVSLADDIDFLTDFLDLEKIRRDNFKYSVSNENNIQDIQVPPFLFIPFVENAIKHNADSDKLSYVDICFKIQNNELYFTCENSKPQIPVKKEKGGLGLHNIRQRLELIYKNNYSLQFNETETTYTVNLHLKL